jgi:hypothetical protein
MLAEKPVLGPKVNKEFASFKGFTGAGFSATGTGPLINLLPVLSQRGHQAIDTMMTDDILGTCIEIKKMAALSSQWSWESASEDPQDVEDAKYLTTVFERLDSAEQDVDGVNIGVVNKLHDMASAVEHGYSITNPVMDVIESGEFAGLYGLCDMKTKPPHWFTFETDEYLNLLPNGLVYNYTDHLPIDQFLIYAYKPRFNNPYGFSDCIRAYDRWNAKVMHQRMESIYLERHACGTWVFTEDKDNPLNAAQRAQVDSFLKGAQAKSALRQTGGGTLTAYEPTGGAAGIWEGVINRDNVQIARSVFFPDKLGFSGGEKAGGAYALGEVHMDMWVLIVTSLQRDLAIQMKRLGRKLIVASKGEREKYPNFVFSQMTAQQKAGFITAVAQLTTAGYLDPSDPTVRNKVREMMELPEEDKVPPAPTPAAVAPDPNAPDPNADPSAAPANDPNAEPDVQNYAAPDAQAIVDQAMAEIAKTSGGVVIVGGPKTLKTTIATLARERFKIKVRHADSLLGTMGGPPDEWSATSEVVSEWFDAPGRWLVEGVVTARAIRKWLAAHPDEPVPFTIMVLSTPVQARGKGQASMAASITTVWNEIEPELEARGASVTII